jgi:hypothetical protein
MFGRRNERSLLGCAAREPLGVRSESCAIACRIRGIARVMQCATRDHDDAIHRTGRDTQFAPGAQLRNDRMGQLLRAHDRIHRTGRETFDTTDAAGLIDLRNKRRSLDTICRIERQRFAAKSLGE